MDATLTMGRDKPRYLSHKSLDERIEELYRSHGARSLRLAIALTGAAESGEDLVQEAFARLLRSLRDRRTPERVDLYLRRTLINLATSRWRRQEMERDRLRRVATDVFTEAHNVEEQQSVWGALMTLAPRQRAALFLRYYEDLSERQVADVMDCSVSAAKALISRGLTKLRLEKGAFGDE